MGFLLPSNNAAMIAGAAGMAASWIMSVFEEIRANNVSANGLYLCVTPEIDDTPTDKLDAFFVSKFADDENPITFHDYSATNAEPSFNGPVLKTAQVPFYVLDVSVIPFTEDDNNLRWLWTNCSDDSNVGVSIWVVYIRPNPEAMKPFGLFSEKTKQAAFQFMHGAMLDARPAPSVSQYRLTGMTYSFGFSGLPTSAGIPPSFESMRGTWSL